MMMLAMLSNAASASTICSSNTLDGAWASQCFDVVHGGRRVKQEFVGNLKFNRNGIATVLIDKKNELVAVNRRGEIVVPNIRHTGDFDYPDAPSRIGRYEVEQLDHDGKVKAKCGYFSMDSYEIILPAQFDHCQSFKTKETSACNDCAAYCNSEDCQNITYVGGAGFVIRRDGKIARKLQLPGFDEICKVNYSAKVVESRPGLSVLQCVVTK